MKRLLVNADDLGLSEGVTDGIIEAYERGIVTSTSIIAAGTAFGHAVKQVLSHKGLGVGVHLTLVEEQPVSDPADIPSLVQPNGKLPRNYTQLLSGVLLGRIRSEHIERELRAQVVKCLDAGLTPTHLDSHQHVHALPSIFRIVIRSAEDFHIGGIRIPRDSPAPAVFWREGFFEKTALCLMAHWDAHLLSGRPLYTCDRMAGLFDSGALSELRLLEILENLQDGTTELVCHPGKEDAKASAKYAHWHYDWKTELNALSSEAVRDAVRARGIELISYNELASITR